MNHTAQVIRVRDLAKALAVSPQTVRNRVKDGSLPPQRKLGRGRGFWLAADLAGVLPAVSAEQPKQAA